MGVGMGMAFTPLLELSMADVPPDDVGLASGIVQVSMQIAGAFGLAVLSTLATSHTHSLVTSGDSPPVAFSGGFTLAVTVGAVAVAAGILIALTTLRRGATPAAARSSTSTSGSRSNRRPEPPAQTCAAWRFSSIEARNSSVDWNAWSGPTSSARSLVILPLSTVSMQTRSSVSANAETSGVSSRRPRACSPRVQAKIEAIGLVEVGLPCWCWR